MKRGRPKEAPREEQPLKFNRTYVHSDGTIATWKYDLTKYKFGPIEVSFDDRNVIPVNEIIAKETKVKADKKQYLNPVTGRYVAAFRAKQLGLI